MNGPNSPDLNQLDYQVWNLEGNGVLSQAATNVIHDIHVTDTEYYSELNVIWRDLLFTKKNHEFSNKLNWIVEIWGVLLVKVIQFIQILDKWTKTGEKLGLCLSNNKYNFTQVHHEWKYRKKSIRGATFWLTLYITSPRENIADPFGRNIAQKRWLKICYRWCLFTPGKIRMEATGGRRTVTYTNEW